MSDEAKSHFSGIFQTLAEVLKYPPYFSLLYISSIFILASIISNNYFEQTLTIFIYSIAGIFWRHIHTDYKAIYNPTGQLDTKINKKAVLSYQTGNVVFLILLISLLIKLTKL